jgi:hypothetical protein
MIVAPRSPASLSVRAQNRSPSHIFDGHCDLRCAVTVPPELALKRFQYFSSSTVSGFQCVGGSGLITRFSMPGMRVLADQD